MASSTFTDHLGRLVVESQIPGAKGYLLEVTKTTTLDCKWHLFIYPQFSSHLHRDDPFFISGDAQSRIINLKEAGMQIAREAIGIYSDPASQVGLIDGSIKRCKIKIPIPDYPLDFWERPGRFSASKLLERQVMDDQIKEVAYLFFLESALNANLMAPSSLDALRGFEAHIFHSCSNHIIVGLPICFMEVSARSEDDAISRKVRLLAIIKKHYPSKLSSGAETGFKRGRIMRRAFTTIYQNQDKTLTQKLALMEMKMLGPLEPKMNFYESCAVLFRKMVSLTEVDDEEINGVRYKFLEILAFGAKDSVQIHLLLKKYLNSTFPRSYFSAYDLFMEMYGNKILNSEFLIPQMFVISLEENPQVAIQKMDHLFMKFGN